MNPLSFAVTMGFQFAYDLNWNEPVAVIRPPHPGGYQVPPGANECCKIGDRADGVKVQQTSSSKCPPTGTFCGLGGQVPDGVHGEEVIQGGNGRYVKIFLGPATQISPLSWRMSYDQIWQVDRGASNPKPALKIEYRAAERAIAAPLPRLRPAPAALAEYYTPPKDETRVLPRMSPRPYQRPAIDVRINPRAHNRGARHVPPVDSLHDLKQAKRPQKEKKHQLRDRSKFGPLLYALYDKTTEAKDIMDILYNNLPPGKKCSGATDLSSKSYCVWKNLKHLDIEQSIKDLIRNHIEDKAWGKFFSYGKKSPFGSQLPGGTQPQIQLSQRT
ncbi:MAG: hypothetical protein H3C50_11870 [Kiritimatiellae bacterium]|nr:hypothetical protein [Kiritimatiellia bacterium]